MIKNINQLIFEGDILNKLKDLSPAQLVQYMEDIHIRLGFWSTKDNCRILSKDERFWDEKYTEKCCYFLKPEELFKHKVGFCWETSIAFHEILKHKFHVELCFIGMYRLNAKTYHNPTHTFCVIKDDNNKWYWIEYTFNDFRGVNGPFSSYQKVIDHVKSLIIRKEPSIKILKINPKFPVDKALSKNNLKQLEFYNLGMEG